MRGKAYRIARSAPPSEYLLTDAALPTSPSPTERTSSHPRIIIDADCTNSYILNSGVTEANLTKFL